MTDQEILAAWDKEAPVMYPLTALAMAQGTLVGLSRVTDDPWISDELEKLAVKLGEVRQALYDRGV